MTDNGNRPTTPKQFLGGIDYGMVSCRMVGHNWGVMDNVVSGRQERSVVFACSNCPTTRQDHIHPRTGELIHRQYTYALGYRKPKSVIGRVNIMDVRVEFLKRIG